MRSGQEFAAKVKVIFVFVSLISASQMHAAEQQNEGCESQLVQPHPFAINIKLSQFQSWLAKGRRLQVAADSNGEFDSDLYAFMGADSLDIVDLIKTGFFSPTEDYDLEEKRYFLATPVTPTSPLILSGPLAGPPSAAEAYRAIQRQAQIYARTRRLLSLLGIHNELIQLYGGPSFNNYLDGVETLAKALSFIKIWVTPKEPEGERDPEMLHAHKRYNDLLASHAPTMSLLEGLPPEAWDHAAEGARPVRGFVVVLNHNAQDRNPWLREKWQISFVYSKKGIPAADIAAIIPQGVLEQHEIRTLERFLDN
jgi:hypothetical protein